MIKILYLAALFGMHGALSAAEATRAGTGKLVPQDAGGVVWESAAGRAVRINEPQLTLEDASDSTRLPFKVELKGRKLQDGQAVLEYLVSLNDKGFNISGSATLKASLLADPQADVLIGHIELDWYRGYMKALLDEYARDVDGLVWDETFYIPVDFISHGRAGPALADRAMMSLVAELTQMVQSYQDRNPDLVLLAADNGTTSYALAAHGTYQDSGTGEQHWGPSMFANYRNSLWSCNWCPVTGAANNQIAAEKYGLPQGGSNGWGDNCGPGQMPPELLEAVLKRFTKNVESKRQRLRYLAP